MSHSRVCFVLPSAYGYFNTDVDVVGGGARQLSFISRELTDEFDVHFVVGDYDQEKQETYDSVTLQRSYTPSPDTPGYWKPIQLAQLLAAMRRADADVYIYRGRPFQATVVYLLARLLGRKWMYNLANDPNINEQPAALPGFVESLFKRALDNADAIITQTDNQAEKLRTEQGVPSTVIPSGYPLAESVQPHDEREYFLWVGRLDQDQKRPHLYVDVAEKVPEAEFLVVGPTGQNDSYNSQLLRRMAELPNLEYVGAVDPTDIHEYYRNAVALVNTSAYEGFPSTYLEAWRYETPVVSLDIPVTRYTNLDEYAGDADGEFDRLVDIVSSLAGDVSLREELAASTSEYFKQNLTIEQVANQYRDVLRRVLDS